MKKTALIITFFLFSCLLSRLTFAESYYISGSAGNDLNPGTLAEPWKTIAKANSSLNSGDTVYIRTGTYAETIRPSRSGTAGNYISYKPYNHEKVTIGGAISNGAVLSDRQYLWIEELNFITVRNYWIEGSPNAKHCVIKGNKFSSSSGASMSYEGIHFLTRCDYNTIIENSLESGCEPFDLLMIWDSSYNRVEGNYFGNAAHIGLNLQARGTSVYNVIRNNTFQNKLHTNASAWQSANYTLFEGNRVLDGGDACETSSCTANACGSDRDRAFERAEHGGIQTASAYSIYRNNVSVNNGLGMIMSSWEDMKKSNYNRVYHNTFSKNYCGWQTQTNQLNTFSGNIVKNNIFSNSVIYHVFFSPLVTETDNRFINNSFYGSASIIFKDDTGLPDIQSNYPAEWQDNIMASPGFVSEAARDFTLQPASSMRDAAAWLTTITSATGSGTTFTLADAKYFMDGWGIIAADQIQLEKQTQPVRIKTIDYATNTIQVERSITWTKGLGVSLPYSGSAPDIGAHEYTGASGSAPSAPSGLLVK